jgi:hypothetical protein
MNYFEENDSCKNADELKSPVIIKNIAKMKKVYPNYDIEIKLASGLSKLEKTPLLGEQLKLWKRPS